MKSRTHATQTADHAQTRYRTSSSGLGWRTGRSRIEPTRRRSTRPPDSGSARTSGAARQRPEAGPSAKPRSSRLALGRRPPPVSRRGSISGHHCRIIDDRLVERPSTEDRRGALPVPGGQLASILGASPTECEGGHDVDTWIGRARASRLADAIQIRRQAGRYPDGIG
jgi:hypothetical protein